jgi:hypothetical protein
MRSALSTRLLSGIKFIKANEVLKIKKKKLENMSIPVKRNFPLSFRTDMQCVRVFV